ncbi:bifunctional adenosylcobinamide kinase/adenosylcobinamide-phosphate guanylyltransferase [Fundidesulfovibrio terrae]|uniref:bifunctional adenosylcobinamide kinase/adenosylcobinamide-phosphate guanylyltransferase n=1 Tax=Fundidesulfovibrio terrae TaxID=2922866 RepID=UPI001FAFB308|nr:bifunctional adenosylcobinamide kinase/adenosylcobinamide-phosphate guanylyltransferase [Fundidesulfovibrio terrae]
MIRLILGGEKSGKSDLAYEYFRAAPGPGVVMAMGAARDAAFRLQILEHRLRRDPRVPVLEPGPRLPEALADAAAKGRNVLVDSLDFWLFACMESAPERPNELVGELAEELAGSLSGFVAEGSPACVLVSCEVGLGPIAPTSLARRFARAQGALNQRLARAASEVRLVVAGLPIALK